MLSAMVPENRWTSCSTRLNSAAHVGEVELADVDAVDVIRPLRDVVEPQQQVDQRRLARAGGADDADALAGADLEADVAQDVVVSSLYANQTCSNTMWLSRRVGGDRRRGLARRDSRWRPARRAA